MRLGTIAQAELLDRLGVKGADLYRFNVQDLAVPVVVVADSSEIGGSPQRRQSGFLFQLPAAVGEIGQVEIVAVNAPLLVKIKNCSAASLAVFFNSNPATTPGLGPVNGPAVTYQLPGRPLSESGYILLADTVAPAGVGTPIDVIAQQISPSTWRLSPTGRLIVAGQVVNTAQVIQVQVEEYVAYERQP